MKKEHKHYIIIVLSVLIAVVLITKFHYVFGSNTDWVNQHTIFPDYLRQEFYRTGRLIPNLALNLGAGQNIFNISYYGLLSPVFLPSYFLPFVSMTTYTIVVGIILTIISGLLFYKWTNNNGLSNSASLVASIVFVLSPPILFHMQTHIMFVNYMPFLIMSLMGVDRYFKDNKKSLLIISVFLMIMTSYYYSVCGILVVGLYYLYKYFKNTTITLKNFIVDLFKFILTVCVGILMSSIILLPTLYTMIGRSSEAVKISLLSLLIPSIRIHNIFCGAYSVGISIIGVISLIYLFFTKKKENIIVATLISLFVCMPIFRLLLNGGLYTREKCLIPLLPLIAYFVTYFLNDLIDKKVDTKKFTILLVLTLIPLNIYNHGMDCLFFTLAFICILPFVNSKKFSSFKFIDNKIFNKDLPLRLLIVLIIAFSFLVVEHDNRYGDQMTWDKYNEMLPSYLDSEINSVLDKDDSYYRSANLIYPTKSVNKIYGKNYYTTSIYSSNYNKYYLEFVKNTFKASSVDYNYFQISGLNDLLFNTFMGTKYLISSYNPGLGYTKVSDNIYKNDNVLPLIYGTNHLINKSEFDEYEYPYKDIFLLKNAIVDGKTENKITDTSLEKINLDYEVVAYENAEINKNGTTRVVSVPEDTTGKISIKLSNPLKNKLLFITLKGLEENDCIYMSINIKINDISNTLTCKTWEYPNHNNDFHYLLAKETVETLDVTLTPGVYYIDDIETYIMDYNDIDNINDNIIDFKIDTYGSDLILGNITMDEDGYLITSIPYDKGFSVFVDGKNVNSEIVNTAFLGVKVGKGNHEVKIKYSSPWYRVGIIGSLIGLLSFIMIYFMERKKKN